MCKLSISYSLATEELPYTDMQYVICGITILIRDNTEQTNPEKYNRHTQQIMNVATQLAVKELLKSKCLVQFINTSTNI